MLVDKIRHDMFRLRFDGNRFHKPALHQTQNLRLQRGTEQHGLPFTGRRQLGDDPAHIGNKPHVEHPVGFINHQNLRPGKIQGTAACIIQNTPRRSGKNIHRVIDRIALLLVIHSSEDGFAVKSGILAERLRVLFDLHGKFARRFQNEHATGFRRTFRLRIAEQTGHGRRKKRGGLSGSGLCLGGKIASGDRIRQAFLLNHGTVPEAKLLSSGKNFLCEIHIAETGLALGRLDFDQFRHRRRRLGRADGSLLLHVRLFRFPLRLFRFRGIGLLLRRQFFCAGHIFLTAARRILSFTRKFFSDGSIDKTFS